jgi:hypothetical protein
MALFCLRCGPAASTTGRALIRELFALAAEHRLSFLRACAWVLRGQASIAADRHEDGLLEVERALSEFDALHAGLGQPWALTIAAAGCARLGRRATLLLGRSLLHGELFERHERLRE